MYKRQAQNAYARCIRPAGTMADGDTVYAASVGGFRSGANSSPGSLSGAAGAPAGIVRAKADINFAGTLAARVIDVYKRQDQGSCFASV